MAPSHAKKLSIQIAGYHPTIRTRNSCCNGGLRHFTLLGANHILHGLLCQTHSRTTRKAFVRSQKNDANDALAICETALRPGIHFVAVKTTEQQDIKALRNTRQLMVEQKTALANQLRFLLAEYGVTLPVGIYCIIFTTDSISPFVNNPGRWPARRGGIYQ